MNAPKKLKSPLHITFYLSGILLKALIQTSLAVMTNPSDSVLKVKLYEISKIKNSILYSEANLVEIESKKFS